MEQQICLGCMRTRLPGETVCPECGYQHNREISPEYALQPGWTLKNGKYLVGRILGQGGFGITYIALDRSLELKVAIKEYFPMNQASRDRGSASLIWSGAGRGGVSGRESFLKEARKMAKADAITGIVQVREVFYENNTAYIVMNFIEGKTLKQIIRQDGPMKPEFCIELLRPAMTALEQAHRLGLIHRDISPDNIMIDHLGQSWLLDMGAAKDLDPGNAELSYSTQAVIKRGFSPPEQYTDPREIGTWSDVYAMCATICYCITGKEMPDAVGRLVQDDLVFPPDIPQKLARVLSEGLALHKEDRIQNMGELLAALDGKRTSGRQRKRPADTAGKSGQKREKKKGVMTALIVILLCFALAAAGFAVRELVRRAGQLSGGDSEVQHQVPTVLTLRAESGSWVYDGTAHSLREYEVSGLRDGDQIENVRFSEDSVITDAGSVPNEILSVSLLSSSGEAVATGKYEMHFQTGTLTVTRFPLTLTAVSAEKSYDGMALLNTDVKSTPLANREHQLSAEYTVYDSTGSPVHGGPVEVGSYVKKVSRYQILCNGEDVTKNYDVQTVDGTLTISAAAAGSETGSRDEGRPSDADLRAIGSQIEYPKASEYYDHYVHAVVKAPGGHSVYAYGSADHQGSVYTVLDGEEVIILAERNGYCCVIIPSQNRGRWVNSEYLVPIE